MFEVKILVGRSWLLVGTQDTQFDGLATFCAEAGYPVLVERAK